MTDTVRVLTDDGIARFGEYLTRVRVDSKEPVPYDLLTNAITSAPLGDTIAIERKAMSDRFSLGEYLVDILRPLDRRTISHNYGLWTWLALYFFDDISPLINGQRNVLEDAVYILDKVFNHRRYYRHLLRASWLLVREHAQNARVMLIMRDKGLRSEIFEQLAATQAIFGSRTIIAGAYRLYFDLSAQRPKRGAGGKGPGSPRRLTAIVQQLDLTYDLNDCTVDQFLGLLPKEFSRFKNEAAP
jgi:hypothetical protein